MAGQAGRPARLRAKKLDGYESFSGGLFPDEMVAVYSDYVWEGRPIQGTDWTAAPLFWTLGAAAFSLGMSVEDYLALGYSVSRPAAPQPLLRPKTLLYAPMNDAASTTLDLAGEALSPRAADLRALGVFCGRAYPFGGNAPGAEPTDIVSGGSALCHGLPWESIELVGDTLPVFGPVSSLRPTSEAPPVKGGTALYVTVLDKVTFGAGSAAWFQSDNDVSFEDLANLFDHDLAFIENQAALHDRVLWYLALGLDNYFVVPDPGGEGVADRAALRLAEMKAATEFFDYGLVGSITDPDPGFLDNRDALKALILARAEEFFGLEPLP